MTYDVHTIRSHFPSLNTGLAFFCGPGGSQVPLAVGEAISRAITKPISNRNINTESEKNAEEYVVGFRQARGHNLHMTSLAPWLRTGDQVMK
jgi:selenocysteine lyase/cysteine desulfurase